MHEIQALIGSDTATAALTRTWSEARRRELSSDLFIVPLRRQLVRQATRADWVLPDLEDPLEAPKLAVAVAPLTDAIRRINVGGTCAPIFTQYWDGPGTQASFLVRDGVASVEPLFGPKAINQALSQLGVRADGERDEFDTVGLGRWRSTEAMAESVG
jgi:hypothetical protein